MHLTEQPRPSAERTSPGGFTLLEVMIALAILAVSLVAIAGINSSAIDMHAYSKRLTVATMLARSKMADLESKLMSEDLPADDTSDDGSFEEDGFAEYKWHAEIIRPKTENVSPANLLAMAGLDTGGSSSSGSSSSTSGSSARSGLLGMLGGGAAGSGSAPQGQSALLASAATGGGGLLGGAMSAQLQTMLDMLGKSVREVHLTVSWQTGKTVDQFTVVTHVVSFGRDTATANSDPLAQSAAASGSGAASSSPAGSGSLLNNLVNGGRGLGSPFGGGLQVPGAPGFPTRSLPGGVGR